MIASLALASGAAQWPLIVISSLGLFTGLQIICTGVIAVYLSSVLNESRARPTYVVGNKLGAGFALENSPKVVNVAAVSRR